MICPDCSATERQALGVLSPDHPRVSARVRQDDFEEDEAALEAMREAEARPRTAILLTRGYARLQ